eukprot:TRINITY_DN6610_c0_g1_i4.p2 TRINITY_DN6610_c0_g1~~TRINITY_DN6610_c0_g1_i4.p2  ORF type:complete len:130 (-),score=7.41 TRINITY_DN6610_c0_g1_i4:126-515(-)
MSRCLFCGLDLVVLFLEIFNGFLNSVLSEHTAMQLDRGQLQIGCDVAVLNVQRLINGHSSDEFSGIRAARDGGPATIRLILIVFLRYIKMNFGADHTLNTAFSMVFPSGPTSICSFMTSPHAGAPTSPE